MSQYKSPDQFTDLQEHQIAAYLSRHPDFFARHPYLLLELQLHSDDKGLPNLALQQQRLLREQNAAFKAQISDLIRHARDNERVFKLFSACQRQLANANSVTELQTLVSHELGQVPNISHCQLFEFELRFTALVANRLGRRGHYLGRLSHDEQALLWPEQSVQSVALYLLGDSQAPLALLALASDDPEHFAPDNDNLLISEFILSLSSRLKALS
ncbi:DUF484 family protein [Pseudoalteromonas fenneropenaei]|uniref:DUF484 family protein n=1 Tax=Pseudoalteromonas fenneropenaei TaxID=1737459 RepID=A0ABV7CPA2_9GAMM